MQVHDWATMIEHLERHGVARRTIGARMFIDMTDRMLIAYKRGSQPAAFRGLGLIQLWAETFGPTYPCPMAELLITPRERRAEAYTGPRIMSLPQWPPVDPVSVKPVKRGRPKKVAEAA